MARLDPGTVVSALMQRGVPQHVAQGVVMNFQDESGLNTGIQEKNPRAGRGGFGLAQWTGSRRTNLENYAASQGKSADDPNVQLDFFMQENQGPEAKAWQSVMASPDVRTAAQSFVRDWERPAPENVALRATKYAAGGQPAEPTAGTAVAGGVGGFTPAPPGRPIDRPADKPEGVSVSDTLADLGTSLTGSAGGMKGIPNVQMAKPQTYTVEPAEALTQNPQAIQAQRDRLAMAMARLNSGKLWVG